jgi:two-component SAPR family response regulator
MPKKRYTCIIIEDDPAFLMMLSIAVRKINELEIIGTYAKAFDAMNALQEESPNILISDINVQGHKGTEIVNLCETYPKLILVSSHPETIMEEYPIPYTAYLQKPLAGFHLLNEAVAKCIKELG